MMAITVIRYPTSAILSCSTLDVLLPLTVGRRANLDLDGNDLERHGEIGDPPPAALPAEPQALLELCPCCCSRCLVFAENSSGGLALDDCGDVSSGGGDVGETSGDSSATIGAIGAVCGTGAGVEIFLLIYVMSRKLSGSHL